MLETAHYKIRKLSLEDAFDYYAIISDDIVARSAGLKPTKSLDVCNYLVSGMIFQDNTYVIVHNEIVIGTIGLYQDFLHKAIPSIEIGFMLNRNFHRKKVMEEVLRTFIPYLFLEYDMICLLVFTDNIACIKLAQKLGFVKDGILYGFKKLDNGLIKDVYLYTLKKGI